jgi:DNA-binding MarR family transcriptional regulator
MPDPSATPGVLAAGLRLEPHAASPPPSSRVVGSPPHLRMAGPPRSTPVAGPAPKRRVATAGQRLGPGESPGFLLWRVTLRWQRVMAAALRPLGLTHVQFVLLASAWWLTEVAGETPSQRRLAEHAGTDPMMTSQVVRSLEANGLVTRVVDPADSRARLLGVTPAGLDLARRAVGVVEAADAEFFAAAGPRPALLRILHRLDADT